MRVHHSPRPQVDFPHCMAVGRTSMTFLARRSDRRSTSDGFGLAIMARTAIIAASHFATTASAGMTTPREYGGLLLKSLCVRFHRPRRSPSSSLRLWGRLRTAIGLVAKVAAVSNLFETRVGRRRHRDRRHLHHSGRLGRASAGRWRG